MNRQESIKHFQSKIRELFGFLPLEYGFVELPPKSHHELVYQSASIAIEVRGVSWGTATEVHIRPLKDIPVSQIVAVPLWSIIQVHHPELYEAFSAVSGQIPQAEASAKIIREIFPTLLSGDTSLLAAPRTFLENRVEAFRNGHSQD
jgi:hypothetical protein